MSWWIYLEDEHGPVSVQPHTEGGTYTIGGASTAELNVTYNYSEVTRLVDFHFNDSLHDKKAADTIATLENVVAKLGTRTFSDYWAPTPGNAGHAADILLGWAKQYPNAIWRVS